MGRELQKKKRRSGRQPVRASTKSKKVFNPRGNNVIAANWNKKETLAQNYKRLGLVSKLKAPTGGIETTLGAPARPTSTKTDGLAIASMEQAILSEARVERDASGAIIRVLGRVNDNPLKDPLRGLDSDSDAEEEEEEMEEWGGIDDPGATDVVKSLVRDSRVPVEKKVRYQSDAEREWLGRLVRRYGDDTRAMSRDRKLNPMQQTARDLAKRIKKLQNGA